MKFYENNQTEKQQSLQEEYDNLKNCSAEQLMQKLANEIDKQKTDGVFDADGLIQAIENMKWYLPKQTYENMIRIAESLK